MAESDELSTGCEYRAVGIFWDIENCVVPKGKSVTDIVNRIKSVAKVCESDDNRLDVFCCASNRRLDDSILRCLQKLNIDVLMVCRDRNSADNKLITKMNEFLEEREGKEDRVIVLISGDSDYMPTLTRAQQLDRTEVLVIYWNNCSQQLLNSGLHIETIDCQTFKALYIQRYPNSCRKYIQNKRNFSTNPRKHKRMQSKSNPYNTSNTSESLAQTVLPLEVEGREAEEERPDLCDRFVDLCCCLCNCIIS